MIRFAKLALLHRRGNAMKFQESETIELKAQVTEGIVKELIAFANMRGGTIYIGIADDGTIIGLDSPDLAAVQVSNKVRDSIKPDVTMFLHYETLQLEDSSVLKIDVQKGTNCPYYLAQKGLRPAGVFVRQRYSSVPASDDAIRQMIKETDGDNFETMRSLEQNLTFKAADQEFKKRKLNFEKAQMKSLGLIGEDGLYTNLGLLLSDQCPTTIKVAIYQDNDYQDFQDRREFTGSLFTQLEEVYQLLDLCNQTHARIQNLLRYDTRNYPDVAVREALLNSIVHRDYSVSDSSMIYIFPTSLEILSMGGLVPGLQLDDILNGVSRRRNKNLSEVFYRLHLIEAYGTGLHKIMAAYQKTSKSPALAISSSSFKIILPNLNAEESQTPKNLQNISSETQAYTVLTPLQTVPLIPYNGGQSERQLNQASVQKTDQTLSEPFSVSSVSTPTSSAIPSKDQLEVLTSKHFLLRYLASHDTIARREVEDLLGLTQASAGRLLSQLVRDGILLKVGRGPSTRYTLAKNEKGKNGLEGD